MQIPTFFRVVLDRYSANIDAIWSSLDFTIHQPNPKAGPVSSALTSSVNKDWYDVLPTLEAYHRYP